MRCESPELHAGSQAEGRLLRYKEPSEPRVLIIWGEDADAFAKELIKDYGYHVTNSEEGGDEDSRLMNLDGFYIWLQDQKKGADSVCQPMIQQLLDELEPIVTHYDYLWFR